LCSSSLSLELKLSRYPLSQGLPGSEPAKPLSNCLGCELVVRPDVLGRSKFDKQVGTIDLTMPL
jgi:hypothetical protein